MDETPTREPHTLDGTMTQSLQSSPSPGPPTQSCKCNLAILSSPHPGVSQQTQNLRTSSQALMPDRDPPFMRTKMNGKYPHFESEIVILGGSKPWNGEQDRNQLAICGMQFLPGAKLQFKKMFAASEKTPHTSNTKIFYPCRKWSQDYKRPPSTRVTVSQRPGKCFQRPK